MSSVDHVANIPKELQECSQWCIAIPGNKAPLLPDDRYIDQDRLRNASNVSDAWLSFSDAVDLAKKHDGSIGFVITKADPYVCIDLDIKDAETFDQHGEPHPVSSWTTKESFRRYEKILDMYDTYAEVSASGKGLHIWLRGEMNSGCRRDGVEVYPRDRFIICTGKSISKAEYMSENGVVQIIAHEKYAKPIVRRQNLLDALVTEIRRDADIKRELSALVEVDPIYPDQELFNRGASADNAEKFIDLCNGNWQKYSYPSQSEADYALLSMLCFYSESNSQVRRMFRATQLGVRKKATANDVYINRSLQYIRQAAQDKVEIEINLDRQSRELKRLYNRGSANPVETKIKAPLAKFEQHSENGIDWPPGKAGELAKFIYHSSPRPIKEVSIVAAMGFLAGVLGKTYTIPQSGLNLYIVLVARSAVGKEAMLSGIGLLLAKLRNSLPGVDKFVNFDSAVSGPALIKLCEDQPSFVNVNGEWGRTLKRLADETRYDPGMQQLRTVMTNLYQKSGPSSIVGGLAYSNKDNNVSSMGGVAYSMIGDTTPGTFYESINDSTMEDGFMSRFTIIQYDGLRPEKNDNPILEPSPELATYLTSMVSHSIQLLDTNQHNPIKFDPMVEQLANAFNKECDAQINSTEDEAYRQMWNRAHLKLLRWCGLLAGCQNYISPVVTMPIFEWALDIIRRDIKMTNDRLQAGDIGIGDSPREKKIISILKSYLKSGAPNGYSIPKLMQQDGVITRRFIQIRTNRVKSFSSHRNGTNFAITSTIKSLEDMGILTEIDRLTVAKRYGSNLGKCYRITNLPTNDAL